jgi:hypothetical protein
MEEIPANLEGWWRIVDTETWGSEDIDLLGPALLSLTGTVTGSGLLAYVDARPTKAGVSFTWEGAWEYDQVSGTETVTVRKGGRLGAGSGSRTATRTRPSRRGRRRPTSR